MDSQISLTVTLMPIPAMPVKSLISFSITGFCIHVTMMLLTVLPLTGQNYLFQINDFKASNANINLEGGTSIVDGKLRLTPDKPQQSGACWYKAKKIDFTEGFETELPF